MRFADVVEHHDEGLVLAVVARRLLAFDGAVDALGEHGRRLGSALLSRRLRGLPLRVRISGVGQRDLELLEAALVLWLARFGLRLLDLLLRVLLHARDLRCDALLDAFDAGLHFLLAAFLLCALAVAALLGFGDRSLLGRSAFVSRGIGSRLELLDQRVEFLLLLLQCLEFLLQLLLVRTQRRVLLCGILRGIRRGELIRLARLDVTLRRGRRTRKQRGAGDGERSE